MKELIDLYGQIDWKESSENSRLNSFQRLTLTMLWLRNYPSLKILAWIANMDPSSISRMLNDTVELLWNALKGFVAIPRITERLHHAKRIWNYLVVLVVDGTEQKVLQSKKKAKANITYSGKKKMHTFTKLIAVTPNGKICFISDSYPGI